MGGAAFRCECVRGEITLVISNPCGSRLLDVNDVLSICTVDASGRLLGANDVPSNCFEKRKVSTGFSDEL